MEKISVLVPIYNAEKYIEKCLDSIVNQTYENIEIVLIEDGSTDNSLEIIKEYSKQDKRIKIISIKNNGVADARNKALENATGDYVTFVDSDDYVEKDYVETLYTNLKKYEADIAVCNCYNIIEKTGSKNFKTFGINKVKEFNNIEAVENLFYYNFFRHSPWGKLYKKNLWNNIKFPVGKNYEDLATIYKLFLKSKNVIYIPKEKYNYLIRQGSIIHNEMKKEDVEAILEYTQKILQDITQNYPTLIPSAEYMVTYLNLSLWKKVPVGKYKEYDKTIKNNIKKYRISIIKNKKVNKKPKCMMLLSFLGRRIYRPIILRVKK